MKRNGDLYILSSGKEFYANNGIIGLDQYNNELSEGYDGHLYYSTIYTDKYHNDYTNLSNEDRIEIANYMIEQWKNFRDSLEK